MKRAAGVAVWVLFGLMACGVDEEAPVLVGSQESECRFYCAVITHNCTHSARQYASFDTCANFCLRFSPGDPNQRSAGDTLTCRLFYAMAGSPEPAHRIFCNNAGPTGGISCRDP